MAQHRRRIFLINPRFQIKFSILICLLIFISSIFYPLTIYDLINKFIAVSAQSDPAGIAGAQQYKTALIVTLALFQIGFILLSFIITIFLTHKVAGPMYKLLKFLKAKREGEETGKLFFRSGDYFPEVADEFNKTFDQLQEQYTHDIVYLGEVCSYLNNLTLVVPEDKKIVLEEIIAKLEKIQSKFK